tara:strand:- start:2287 stop:2472 length:186 start_codon:yes stop_codon:yes gene_type:complete
MENSLLSAMIKRLKTTVNYSLIVGGLMMAKAKRAMTKMGASNIRRQNVKIGKIVLISIHFA